MRRYLLALTSPPPPALPGLAPGHYSAFRLDGPGPLEPAGQRVSRGESPLGRDVDAGGWGSFPYLLSSPARDGERGPGAPPPDRTEAILDASRRAVLLPEPLSRCPRLGALSRSP